MFEKLEYLIGAGVGIVLLILVQTIRYFVEQNRRKMADRLTEADEEGTLGVFSDPRNSLNPLEDLVANTGLDLNGWQALAWIILVGVLMGSLLFLLRPEWWMAAIGLALGCTLVYSSFFVYKARYRSLLQSQLPDTFYLLARSLRAGLSLEQSLSLVANQGLQPLAGEFKRCSSQIRLGLPVASALDNMAKRLQLLDFNAFVSAISLFQLTGGNLPVLLDRLAGNTRDHVQFASYFKSATALGRLSAYAIAAAGPGLFLVYAFVDPDYIATFFNSRLGLILFFFALGLEIVGLIWIRLLLKSEYY